MAETGLLMELGLTDNEARVYLALLETGSTLAGAVIKKTGLHRATAYQVLQRLREKGLVGCVIKGRKQFFEPANPERLLDVLRDREERLREALPRLKAKLAASQEKQEVTVYHGVKGIRSALDKMLEELTPRGEYFDFGVSGLWRDVMPVYWEKWQREKKRRGIASKVIFNEAIKAENPEFLEHYHGLARFHPRKFASPTDTIIYKDTVILFIWTAKPPIAVVIKNKENAEGYKNQFKLMWRQAGRE